MDRFKTREVNFIINANFALAELKDRAMYIANSTKLKDRLINLSNFVNSKNDNSIVNE